jgi:hypothetical protein
VVVEVVVGMASVQRERGLKRSLCVSKPLPYVREWTVEDVGVFLHDMQTDMSTDHLT